MFRAFFYIKNTTNGVSNTFYFIPTIFMYTNGPDADTEDQPTLGIGIMWITVKICLGIVRIV